MRGDYNFTRRAIDLKEADRVQNEVEVALYAAILSEGTLGGIYFKDAVMCPAKQITRGAPLGGRFSTEHVADST